MATIVVSFTRVYTICCTSVVTYLCTVMITCSLLWLYISLVYPITLYINSQLGGWKLVQQVNALFTLDAVKVESKFQYMSNGHCVYCAVQVYLIVLLEYTCAYGTDMILSNRTVSINL